MGHGGLGGKSVCVLGVGGWKIQGVDARCRTMTSKLCHELPATRGPHYHMKCHRRAFSFSPSDSVFHSLAVEGGEEGHPTQPQLTMEHKVLAEGTSQCTLGLFLITVSGCDSECALADDRLPPSPPLPPTLEMSRQPVFCAFPWLAPQLLQFTDMSTAAGLQA